MNGVGIAKQIGLISAKWLCLYTRKDWNDCALDSFHYASNFRIITLGSLHRIWWYCEYNRKLERLRTRFNSIRHDINGVEGKATKAFVLRYLWGRSLLLPSVRGQRSRVPSGSLWTCLYCRCPSSGQCNQDGYFSSCQYHPLSHLLWKRAFRSETARWWECLCSSLPPREPILWLERGWNKTVCEDCIKLSRF